MSSSAKLGLRFDVDSIQGVRQGLPVLTQLLARNQVRASLFFCSGPDNTGRSLWQQLSPAKLLQRLKKEQPPAINYSSDKLRCGVIGDGPLIGQQLQDALKDIASYDHEIGVLAWDQHQWLHQIGTMSEQDIEQQLHKAHHGLSKILGRELDCSAAVGARCSDQVLSVKEQFSFRYNSDCYGASIFVPALGMAPQIPVTLPNPAMALSCHGVSIDNYAAHVLSKVKSGQLNVLALRVEDLCGLDAQHPQSELAQQLQIILQHQTIECLPLGKLLDKEYQQWPIEKIRNLTPPGHDAWISYQASCVSECL